jgi:hypothetical protein
MVQSLENIHLESIIAHYTKTMPGIDSDSKLYGLATVLLRHYLGNEWASANINIQETTIRKINRAGCSFLKTDSVEIEDFLRYQERVLRLSELLYNLQNVEGIEGRIAGLRSGTTESSYAELEFAGHFYRRGISVQFLDRTGVKGEDYDFRTTYRPGPTVCCEVKCKLEDTDIGRNTIINTLQDARKQLPDKCPGIIGVKIPESWVEVPESAQLFDTALAQFLRNSDRVIGVVVRWEEVRIVPDIGGLIAYQFKTYQNDRSMVANQDLAQFVKALSTDANENWIRLRTFV